MLGKETVIKSKCPTRDCEADANVSGLHIPMDLEGSQMKVAKNEVVIFVSSEDRRNCGDNAGPVEAGDCRIGALQLRIFHCCLQVFRGVRCRFLARRLAGCNSFTERVAAAFLISACPPNAADVLIAGSDIFVRRAGVM